MSLHEVTPLFTVVERLLDFGPITPGAIQIQIAPRRVYALCDVQFMQVEDKRLTSCQFVHVDAFGAYQPQSHQVFRGWCKKMEVIDLFDKKVGVKNPSAWFIHTSVYGTYRNQATFQILDRLKKKVTIHELSALPAIAKSSRSS